MTNGKGIYYQCGAFKDPANAEKLRAKLQAAGLPVKIVEAGALRRVVAGPFAAGAAEAARARLQAAGVDKPFAIKS